MGVCYDIEGNSVDCSSSDSIGYSSGNSGYDIAGQNDPNAGLNLTSSNPVARLSTDSQNNGGTSLASSIFSSLPSIITSVSKVIPGQGQSSNLRLQINPATGLQQYYNPSTGQYVGGPIGASGPLGGSSLMLVLFALVVAFFAFGGKKRLAAA